MDRRAPISSHPPLLLSTTTIHQPPPSHSPPISSETMKLLGWMHRKFRQDSGGDVAKDYGPSCNCLWVRPAPEENHQDNRRRRLPSLNCGPFAGAEFSFSVVGGGGGEEEEELFEGLLTIGTLGSGPLEAGGEEEEEELFDVAEIAEKEAEEADTEAELMAVGAELEKVLEKEGGGERLSSARPSQGGSAAGAFPLQGYLFGSAVEVMETAEKRRDRRASLGELFMLNKVAEEGEVPASGGGGGGKKRARAGVHVMVKKMLRRRGPDGAGSSSVNSGGGGGPGVAAHPGEAKLQKIMQIFHKKVHPENTMLMKKVKSFKKNKDNGACHSGENYFNKCNGGTDALATSKCNSLNEGIQSFKSRSIGGDSDSNGSREYWIKTDSDYLVLEL